MTEKTETMEDKINNIDPEKSEKPADENSPISIVAATVNTTDDPTLPALTFRFWVLSTVRLIFRTFVIILKSYANDDHLSSSRLLAKFLPTKVFRIWRWGFSLNPGPFNVKEHVCIAAAVTSGGITSAYATDIIAVQELFYGQSVGFINGVLLILSSQIMGYGLAGFLRKYLVRPSNMIWPSSLVYVTMYNTLHGNMSDSRSMAILCLFAPYSKTINLVGSARNGMGVLVFSSDWIAIISNLNPLYVPWWSQVNNFVGIVLGVWIIAPLLYHYNVLDAQKFSFASTHPLDANGERYNQTRILDQDTKTLNITAYEEYSPIYLSTTFAMSYLYSFALITAVMSHVALFHGEEIWKRFRASRNEEEEDIHCKLMNVYPEVPNWWYSILYVIMFIVAIILGYITVAHLPWWGMILSVMLSTIFVLPIGVIQAISGSTSLGLNVITEMVCGYVLPGNPIANTYFKTYGYMGVYQCLTFVGDLKLGHYLKIPPRAMFICQFYGTIIGGITNYWILQLIIKEKRPYLDGTIEDPSGQWSGWQSQVFNTASVIWGLVGPGTVFGPASIYNPMLWGFLIGFVAPFPIYFLHRKYPNVGFDYVNIPLICTGLSVLPGPPMNFIISGIIASFLSQFYAFRYKRKWWDKYNYVLSAAFDSGAQFVTMVIFFCLSGLVQAPFPEWWGNNAETGGERCFADI
ncbi:oligopeptide transporter OPT family [Glomus cerebriforme]|uniref:Oligopeptide transporter OPT family n=1 Tax=Glomus cerebriforme TaxID=658196 RepID=A0A397T4D3_9GLOM|nr:oligopeptide transporter OPT family [Glomus cerebriforme]